ncbi:MAG: 4-hydroxy-3-methylbut-2-enyl diphosphate reductase [Candidatus Omnitrophica bacterium]|nr:4-hydroxy-3-methylbut-2-enyl diphosphate reductase [Candidatus Omnitrophota bacterium]
MKINIARSAGFCFGVKRAITVAQKAADSGATVHMLGDIVHNEDVVQDISRAGIKKVRRMGKGHGKYLLIRAHGAPKALFTRAQEAGYEIVDATCPMVREIHDTAVKAERDGYPLIIIGEKNHDEVRGIIGQLRHKPLVIESIESIPLARIARFTKAAVVVQSTQNLERTLAIIDRLKRYIIDVRFFNTICNPTRTKQNEIKKMPLANEVMLIIGSKTSANTKRLYELSRELNPRTYWIQKKTDLKPEWFKKISSVGVTSGSSTPDSTTQEIIAHLKKITGRPHRTPGPRAPRI